MATRDAVPVTLQVSIPEGQHGLTAQSNVSSAKKNFRRFVGPVGDDVHALTALEGIEPASRLTVRCIRRVLTNGDDHRCGKNGCMRRCMGLAPRKVPLISAVFGRVAAHRG
jgi:hypothetical protein